MWDDSATEQPRTSEDGMPPSPQKARRVKRAETILTEAARLFHERGFPSVGIDEIGARAGITGPGVYRHFRSKDDVLVALMTRAADRFLAGAEDILKHAPTAEAALEQLVRFHVAFVLDDPTLVAVYFQEARNIPKHANWDIHRRRRLYIEHWCAVLAEQDEDLPEESLRVTVNGVLSLINSVALFGHRSERLPMERLLVSMALAALFASAKTESPGRVI